MNSGEEILEMIIRLSKKLENASTRDQYEIAEKLKVLTYVYAKLFKENEKKGAN